MKSKRVISDHALITAILNLEDFSNVPIGMQGATYQISETERKGYKQFYKLKIQNHLDWVHAEMENKAKIICSRFRNEKSFDLQKSIVKNWCEEIALKFIGIKNNENRLQLLKWSNDIFFMSEPEKKEDGATSTLAFSNFLSERLKNEKYVGQESYAQFFAEDNPNPEASISMLIQLFTGLSTSLPLFLGNCLLKFFQEPELIIPFKKEPGKFVNELLRIAGPAVNLHRYPRSNFYINDEKFERIEKGTHLQLEVQQANLDAQVFKEPNQFKMERKQCPHLSLGYGRHACLGAPLIRKSVEILLLTIFDYFPNLEAKLNKVKFGGSPDIQGVEALPVLVLKK